MEVKTTGIVLSVKKQWWLKVNTKPVRLGTLDGAAFPHVVKVKYAVAGNEIVKRKWIGARHTPPAVNTSVTVVYLAEKPTKCRLEL